MTSTSRVLRALAPRQMATLTLILLAAFMLSAAQAQRLTISTVGGAKVKADVETPRPLVMPQPDSIENRISSEEH